MGGRADREPFQRGAVGCHDSCSSGEEQAGPVRWGTSLRSPLRWPWDANARGPGRLPEEAGLWGEERRSLVVLGIHILREYCGSPVSQGLPESLIPAPGSLLLGLLWL